jgi:cytidine deaminase
MTNEEQSRLVAAARVARTRSYAPYSGFHVGAAILGASGQVYPGCNVENASFPVSLCAERAAIAAAVVAGERDLKAVVIVGGSSAPCPPCGMCRQALAEFGPTIELLLLGADGAEKRTTLDAILPDAFGPDFLEHKA